MQTSPLKFAAIPAWAMPAKADRLALWETIELADLTDKWIRLSAADQRAMMGAAPFGKQLIRVNDDGTVSIQRKTCFGMDFEQHDYQPIMVKAAASLGKRLSPGCFGPDYLEAVPEGFQ